MLDIRNRYNAKLLLIGEYTALISGESLAIPYLEYFGYLEFSSNNNPYALELLALGKHIAKEPCITFDHHRFINDIKDGLIFSSTIPQGYGCGSSGALTAAIYNMYCATKKDYFDIKNDLAQIEKFYHGASSGTDPLVIYLNTPVVITPDQIKTYPTLISPKVEFIDSKIIRKTDNKVDLFLKKYQASPSFKIRVDQLSMLNSNAIKAFIEGFTNDFQQHCNAISFLEYEIMKDLIVEEIRPIWEESLNDDSYCIKLNGAGGGGYYLKIIFNQ